MSLEDNLEAGVYEALKLAIVDMKALGIKHSSIIRGFQRALNDLHQEALANDP